MNIVFVTENNFFEYTKTAIASLLENRVNKGKLTLWIISPERLNDIETFKIKLLNRYRGENVNIREIVSAVSAFEHCYTPIHISSAAFNKFQIINLLPNNISKALYLDSDIIVRKDLLSVYSSDIRNYYLAAALDRSKVYAENVGLKEEEYFNSGVMLLNLKKMREDNFLGRVKEFLSSSKNPRQTSDQDAFNIASKGKWLLLQKEWNYILHAYNEEDAEDVGIIHFTSRGKPWSEFYKGSFKKEYQFYYNFFSSKNMNSNLIEKPLLFWTASTAATNMLNYLGWIPEIKVVGFIDKNKAGQVFLERPVYSKAILYDESMDFRVLIASDTYFHEIVTELQSASFTRTAYDRRLWERKS